MVEGYLRPILVLLCGWFHSLFLHNLGDYLRHDLGPLGTASG